VRPVLNFSSLLTSAAKEEVDMAKANVPKLPILRKEEEERMRFRIFFFSRRSAIFHTDLAE
jgi:hypothetical protein